MVAGGSDPGAGGTCENKIFHKNKIRDRFGVSKAVKEYAMWMLTE